MNCLTEAATQKDDGRYAYLAPLYRQVKQAAWDALKSASRAPGVEFNESELQARFPNGARIQLFGGENYQALRGMHLDGIVIDEYGDINPNAWTEVIRPALAIKHGFATFIGTPKGRNHFWKLYEDAKLNPEWFTALYKHQDSGVVADEEIDLARSQMTSDHFAQEYECSFEAALEGAYYARELEACRAAGRITPFAYEPLIAVDTVWDLGYNDSTVILFVQKIGREVRIIEALEDRLKPLPFYANILQSRPYTYGHHYLPHDVAVTELGSGLSRLDILGKLGVRPISVLGKNEPIDGINQARLLFPRVWFNEPKCMDLLNALASYRAEKDDKHLVLKDKPLHDWASHYADAFRYLAISLKDYQGPRMTRTQPTKTGFDVHESMKQKPKQSKSAFSPFLVRW